MGRLSLRLMLRGPSGRVASTWDAELVALAGILGGPRLQLAGGLGAPVHLASAAGLAPPQVPAPGGTTSTTVDQVDPDVIEHVRAAQDGNAYAFATLYDMYVDKVHGYCLRRVRDRGVAEDLTADVFVRALRRITTFTWQGKDFGAWLIAIARNRCHDHLKSARFRMEHAVAEVYDATTPVPSYDARPERGLELAELRQAVHSGLSALKNEHAEVLYLRFIEGEDVEATAIIMDKKPPAIRALQYRALKALAKQVDVSALLGASA